MKMLLIAAGAILLSGSLYAQTPDGSTPANEGICESLKASGVTKGLYGLCVAFCEAQDFADEGVSITDDELLALLEAAPSGSILKAYNRKKSATDPDMPCVMVGEQCPCWTQAELDSMDGFLSDGSVADFVCTDAADWQGLDESGVVGGERERQSTQAGFLSGGYCRWRYEYGSGASLDTLLAVDRGTLTLKEATDCRAAHDAQYSAVCP